MTIEEVAERVEKIRAEADDPETAHSWEDRLHQDVLRAIKNGAANPDLLAGAALATESIRFPRWCA